jgi:hypothetical protein
VSTEAIALLSNVAGFFALGFAGAFFGGRFGCFFLIGTSQDP